MMAHGKTESRLTCAGQAAHLGADYSVKLMILQWIEKKLKQRAFQERHKVMKLEWQKAELERLLEQRKKEVQHGEIR